VEQPGAGSSPAAAPVPGPERQTRLRIQQNLEWSWEKRFSQYEYNNKLTAAEVGIKNVGDVEATGVSVTLVLSDKLSYKLAGPDRIGRKQSAQYRLASEVPLPEGSKPQVEFSCANCRR
jgi:hypothetical protein